MDTTIIEIERQEFLDEFLPTRDIARKFGRTVGDVQYAIKTGKIKAYKLGYFYVIHQDDVPDEWPTEKRG